MVYFLTTGSPQGLLLYSSMRQKRQHRQLLCNISYLYDWQSIWKNYLSIITSLPILSDHSILSKNQNPDSIVLNSIVAFLDLKKAFDTVSHDILLSKYVFIVYHGHVTHKCFSSYLNNHTQKCLVNGSLSECCTNKCGFPQGTTLGPLLFLLCINDLLNCLFHFKQRIYIDDTHLTYSNGNIHSIQSSLNEDLLNINHSLITNK